ncbi:MAG: bifunctional phosphopantothenoylcysteine decarboxylase/phosphopantothenate--cysteine ligase CoaBC [Brevinematales bacterium]|jgi:phosphopantothenoylcysteine decarboxylase/phosphopantothenate--cysteine ligase
MKILLGISAGISIYKIPTVIRILRREGHSVKVIMTPNAARLIDPLLFKAISGGDVFVNDFDFREPLAHITLSDWADVLAVAPASADIIAKIAGGFADSLLTTSILACSKKKILFPAMNTRMLDSKVTCDNLQKLSGLPDYTVVMPDSGDLACGTTGRGRLPQEDKIAAIIGREIDEPLKGNRYIVSAGGTVEKIDPVRYISNFSSGKTGIEIAKALYKKGADVLLVYSNISAAPPSWIPSIKVGSASDMLAALKANLPQYNGLYMAGAPADFRPAAFSESKIKKEAGPLPEIGLVKTPDILKELHDSGLGNGRLIVGFALESENGSENALKKMNDKGLDYIALNMIDIKAKTTPMGRDDNELELFSASSAGGEKFEGSKKDAAQWLVMKTALRSGKEDK